MRDGGKIVGGLVMAGIALAIPAWLAFSHGQKIERPAPPKANAACVEPLEEMRRNHPALLASWRETVVRNGDRVYHSTSGLDYRISLTGTCLGCHGTAADFCTGCHTRAAVTLTCWQCHAEKPSSSFIPRPTQAPGLGGQAVAPR